MASTFASSAAPRQGEWLSRDEFVALRNRQDDQLNTELAGFRQSVHLLREEVFGNMQEIKTNVHNLRTDVHRLRIDINKIKTNINAIKTNIHNLRTDVNGLRTDVNKIKTNVNQLKTDVCELKTDVNQLKTDVNQIKTDVCELRAQAGQTQALMRNNALRNPAAPIRPLPIYRPGQGVLFPRLFPRNADHFYRLRDPLTTQHREMLAYLVEFYDLRNADYYNDPTGNDDQMDTDEIFIRLETLLGLNEEKFIKFRQRAAQMASRQPLRPAKRVQVAPVHDERLARRPRLTVEDFMERQPPPAARSRSSEDFGQHDRLEWRTRSTPPSQQITVNQLNRLIPKQVTPDRETSKDGTDSDDVTRAFTSPREP